MKDFMTHMRSPSPDEPIWPAFVVHAEQAHSSAPTAHTSESSTGQAPSYAVAAGQVSNAHSTDSARPGFLSNVKPRAAFKARQEASEAPGAASVAAAQQSAAMPKQPSDLQQDSRLADAVALEPNKAFQTGQSDAATSPVRLPFTSRTESATQTPKARVSPRPMSHSPPGVARPASDHDVHAQLAATQTLPMSSHTPSKLAQAAFRTANPLQGRVELPTAATAPGFSQSALKPPHARLQMQGTHMVPPGRFTELPMAELRQVPGTLLGDSHGYQPQYAQSAVGGSQAARPQKPAATHQLPPAAHQLSPSADRLSSHAHHLPATALHMPPAADSFPWTAASAGAPPAPSPAANIHQPMHCRSATPGAAALPPQPESTPADVQQNPYMPMLHQASGVSQDQAGITSHEQPQDGSQVGALQHAVSSPHTAQAPADMQGAGASGCAVPVWSREQGASAAVQHVSPAQAASAFSAGINVAATQHLATVPAAPQHATAEQDYDTAQTQAPAHAMQGASAGQADGNLRTDATHWQSGQLLQSARQLPAADRSQAWSGHIGQLNSSRTAQPLDYNRSAVGALSQPQHNRRGAMPGPSVSYSRHHFAAQQQPHQAAGQPSPFRGHPDAMQPSVSFHGQQYHPFASGYAGKSVHAVR